MHFPFQHPLRIRGAILTTLIGRLVIEADHSDPASIGRPAEWTVEAIELQCTREVPGWRGDHKPGYEQEFVAIPDDHFLHDRLLAELLSLYCRGIDVQWDGHLKAKQTRARAAFGLPVATNDV